MKTTVLLFQNSLPFLNACRLFLEPLGDLVEIHYIDDEDEVIKQMTTGDLQMLITSSLHGKRRDLHAWLGLLSDINPDLVRVSLSTVALIGDFDRVIPKDGNVRRNLISAVVDLYEGRLRRTLTHLEQQRLAHA